MGYSKTVVGICVLLIGIVDRASAADTMDWGMTMMSKAHEAVCWYVYMKNFPNTDPDKYTGCWGNVDGQIGNIKMNGPYYKFYPEKVEPDFSSSIVDNALVNLPDVYQSACKGYLMDSKLSPIADESDALNDGGGNYPYKGYAYCLLTITRGTYGNQAIEDIKKERTHGRKNWMQVMLDSENQARARHGVPPLILFNDLNKGAQAWAQRMADECDMHHSQNPDNLYMGESLGENIAAGGGNIDDLDIRAYYSTNPWYNEIRQYHFPEDVKNQVLNHFTQMVWNSSQLVGYGMAINKECLKLGKHERYTAARYLPNGNTVGEAENNVFPPKDV